MSIDDGNGGIVSDSFVITVNKLNDDPVFIVDNLGYVDASTTVNLLEDINSETLFTIFDADIVTNEQSLSFQVIDGDTTLDQMSTMTPVIIGDYYYVTGNFTVVDNEMVLQM